MTDAELVPLLYAWATLATALGGVSFLVAWFRPTRIKVERYPEIPVELSRLAKAFGITEDVDSGKSYGRMIHDYIEGLKADHDAERRELLARAEAAEAKVKANREALKADVEVALKRLSGITGTPTLRHWTHAPSIGGVLHGMGYTQTVDRHANTETWEYTAGPDGKPWSMTGPVGFIPYEVGVAFANSKDKICCDGEIPEIYSVGVYSGDLYNLNRDTGIKVVPGGIDKTRCGYVRVPA